jgi:uncharacterized protein (DUF2235 family)
MTASSAPSISVADGSRNIIVCCDGTQNQFGTRNTNVVKLVTMLPLNSKEQVSYYDPGVGTLAAPWFVAWGAKWLALMLGSAFGVGLTQNIEEAYAYLMSEYRDGDRVYLFGFSRGAYTVRALSGLLHKCGLLDAGSENLIPYAIQLYKKPVDSENNRVAREFKETFSRECKPHFVGVWDTVASYGWIYNPVTLQYTANDPDIRVIRHAVSLDERRAFFRKNLFRPCEGQDCREVWFPGVHSDVGGGYAEKESGLSKIALEWMVDEAARAGLLIDQEKYREVLGASDAHDVAPDACGPMHESLHGAWWICELLPSRYIKYEDGARSVHWRLPLARRRFVPDGSLIHASVTQRMAKVPSYRPSNLPKSYRTETIESPRADVSSCI